MKSRFLLALAVLLVGCDPTMDVDLPASESRDAISETLLLDAPSPSLSSSPPPPPGTQADTGTLPDMSGAGELVTLGRVLFYERELSQDRTVSCASCHRQTEGFADARRFSRGIGGALTSRQSMSVANVSTYPNGRMFWDERAASLEEQALMPIQDPGEMGLTLDEAIARVEGQPYYEALFIDAFGDSNVSPDRIADALSAFQRTIVTRNSRWDAWLAAGGGLGGPGGPGGPGGGNRQADADGRGVLTAVEEQGRRLFFSRRTQCGACHSGPDLVGDRPFNNGLDLNTAADQGAGRGRFKTASLRNIELTAPYMHDGRFTTLRQVIEHYDSGVQAHPALDNRLRVGNGQPRRLNLSENEKIALEAFLRTLTDETLATDERFSDPFIR